MFGITVSGRVTEVNGINVHVAYVYLHNIYNSFATDVIVRANVFGYYRFDGVYPGDLYSVRAFTPKNPDVEFEPEVIFLDEPQTDVENIDFTYTLFSGCLAPCRR